MNSAEIVSDYIPRHEVFGFLKSLYQNNKRLLGYDFFIIIPGESTLPDTTFNDRLPDLVHKLTNLELIGMSLLDILDDGKFIEEFNSIIEKYNTMSDSDITSFNNIHTTGVNHYKYLYTGAIQYLRNEETNVIIAYEFVYQ